MSKSLIERLRERLNELGVGEMLVDRKGFPFRDWSSDRIGIHEFMHSSVELWDREGRSWIGSPDVALAALADLHRTEDPVDVWERIGHTARSSRRLGRA